MHVYMRNLVTSTSCRSFHSMGARVRGIRVRPGTQGTCCTWQDTLSRLLLICLRWFAVTHCPLCHPKHKVEIYCPKNPVKQRGRSVTVTSQVSCYPLKLTLGCSLKICSQPGTPLTPFWYLDSLVPFPASASVQLYPLTAESQINMPSTAKITVGTCLNLSN